MMAGAGVSLGGAGMLRARRRDVSIKPNRKLDRKSSRGMIYENEELRLRTININAEVEQGQNDIKKLRRENEQLRHEIWSLRDEYDKLEEILKSQKNREDSEDYEDRSETEEKNDDEEAEECTDDSYEEAEEDCDEDKKDLSANYEAKAENEKNEEERLENAENQKISSEKMNTSNHRLHVEFDDLSVVDEEEELKKDKERKDALSSEERENERITKETDKVRIDPSNGYQCFSPRYGSPGTSANSYYPDRSFVYPSSNVTEFRGILPIDPSEMLLTQCPGLYDDTFTRIANYEQPGVANVSTGCNENPRHEPMAWGSHVGWQRNIFGPGVGFQTSESHADASTSQLSSMCPVPRFDSPGQSSHMARTASTARAPSLLRGGPNDDLPESTGRITERYPDNAIFPSLLQRRYHRPRQPMNFHGETIIPSRVEATEIKVPIASESLAHNGWDFGNVRLLRDANDQRSEMKEHVERHEAKEIAIEPVSLKDSMVSAVDRPKHFFAPLPSKIQHTRQDSDDKSWMRTMNLMDSSLSESFGTGKSSSSDRTNSTVISARYCRQPRSQLPTTALEYLTENGIKGPADICVNGGIATYENEHSDRGVNEATSYKSSNNLLIEDKENARGDSSPRHDSNNPIVKSVSCQDLGSEQLQNSLYDITRTFQADGKCQKFAKSDNNLDNHPVIGSPKPFKSQLNVTLKFPCDKSGAGDSSSSSKEHERRSPETPEIPKLPTIDYRLFNNPFLRTFEPRPGIYGNYDTRGLITRPITIRVNESSPERDKMLQQQRPSIDYSSAMLTQSFARRLNPDENRIKSTRAGYATSSEIEIDRHRSASMSSTLCQVPTNEQRIIRSPSKQSQDFQVTSFESPNPRNVHPGLSTYDADSLRVLSVPSTLNPQILNNPKLYQNVPFVPGTPDMFCSASQNPMRMIYDNRTQKVPAQTQTSIDGSSSQENEITEVIVKNLKSPEMENHGTPAGSPTSARRKRNVRKERAGEKTDKRPLSPAAQRRRLRKQSSIDVADGAIEQNKIAKKTRQLSPSVTNTPTTTGSENTEEKNESRSSSSGQESPRKEHNRRVSMYFNGKKRSSLGSVKTTRSFSVDNTRDNFGARSGGGGGGDTVETTNSERERTNSASSREAASAKTRKSSVSSGKVPWCACWGNGCV